jgi:cell division protein FtsQ
MDPPKKPWNWRLWLRAGMWTIACAGLAWGGIEVRSFLRSDERFTLAKIDVSGNVYAKPERIRAVFAADMEKSVFAIPLAERRLHLLAVDWVRTASVTRVWPDRLAINVTERKPVAFARLPVTDGSTRHGLCLIDEEGVLISIPPKVRFRLPVVSGLTEEQSDRQRHDRMEAALHLLADLGERARDISEVNAANVREMKVIADVQGHGYELWMGDQHFQSRYVNFISHFGDIRKHSENATIFDLTTDDRILAKQ